MLELDKKKYPHGAVDFGLTSTGNQVSRHTTSSMQRHMLVIGG